MNGLSYDMQSYEALGFAFLNLTDSQLYRVINHYRNLGHAKIERGLSGQYVIVFGSRSQYFILLKDYMEKYNQSPLDIMDFMGL